MLSLLIGHPQNDGGKSEVRETRSSEMGNYNIMAPSAKQRIQAGHGGLFWDIGMFYLEMKVLDIPT